MPHAAELIVRASMGAVSALNELAPAFTRRTGHRFYVVFAIAIMAAAKERDAAMAFIEFVASPEAGPLLQKGMMEPAR